MPTLVRLVKEFPILALVLAAYLISWGAWIPMGVLEIDFNTQKSLSHSPEPAGSVGDLAASGS